MTTADFGKKEKRKSFLGLLLKMSIIPFPAHRHAIVLNRHIFSFHSIVFRIKSHSIRAWFIHACHTDIDFVCCFIQRRWCACKTQDKFNFYSIQTPVALFSHSMFFITVSARSNLGLCSGSRLANCALFLRLSVFYIFGESTFFCRLFFRCRKERAAYANSMEFIWARHRQSAANLLLI